MKSGHRKHKGIIRKIIGAVLIALLSLFITLATIAKVRNRKTPSGK